MAAKDFISNNLYQESDIPKFSSIPGGKKEQGKCWAMISWDRFWTCSVQWELRLLWRVLSQWNHFSELLLNLDFAACSPGTQKPECSLCRSKGLYLFGWVVLFSSLFVVVFVCLGCVCVWFFFFYFNLSFPDLELHSLVPLITLNSEILVKSSSLVSYVVKVY